VGIPKIGASFFFSTDRGDLASTRKFAVTVAVQLAETSPELRQYVDDAAASSHRIRGLGLYDQWEKLVLRPLAQPGREALPHPLVVVVDALDDCDNNDDVSLLIRCLAAAVAVEHVKLRVSVASRPDQPISIGFTSKDNWVAQRRLLPHAERCSWWIAEIYKAGRSYDDATSMDAMHILGNLYKRTKAGWRRPSRCIQFLLLIEEIPPSI
jgi:hypothetical protein